MVNPPKKKHKTRIVSLRDLATREFLFIQSFRNRIRHISIPAPPPCSPAPVDIQEVSDIEMGADISIEEPPLLSSGHNECLGGVKVHQKFKRYDNSVGFGPSVVRIALSDISG